MTKTKTPPSVIFAEKSCNEIELVVDDQPANIQLSAGASQAIAEHISRSIENLPLDDFMPQPQFKTKMTQEIPVRPIESLPKVIEMLPSQDILSGIKWQQIKNLPGYAISQIRKMGRDTFEAFDCFNAFSDAHRKNGTDPLAEVMVISDLTHNQSAVNALADMIATNGVIIDTKEIDYGDSMPDYHPKVIIFMTEHYTFKLVQDRKENGAPINLNSIYAWEGGLNNYSSIISHTPPLKINPALKK